ncbi:MAG: helix-turn-helix transcriptional regulator [Hyphomicrobiales bacterium]
MMHKYIAVITGNIIGSEALTKEDYEKVIKEVKKEFLRLQTIRKGIIKEEFSFFDDNNFKGVLVDPTFALDYSFSIRTAVQYSAIGLGKSLDCKISIKLERVRASWSKTKLATSSQMKAYKKTRCLLFNSPSLILNEEIDASFSLVEAIIRKWSDFQWEVVFYLLRGYTQQEIASELKISQPAVNKRIKIASWSEIKKFMTYFRAHMSN